MRNSGNDYATRPLYPQSTQDYVEAMSQQQRDRMELQRHLNQAKTAEIERKQKELEQRQLNREVEAYGFAKSAKPGMYGQSPSASKHFDNQSKHMGSSTRVNLNDNSNTAKDLRDSEHFVKGKIKKPAIFALLDDPKQEEPPKLNETRHTFAFGNQFPQEEKSSVKPPPPPSIPEPEYIEEEDDGLTPEEMARAQEIMQQNQAIAEHIKKLREQNSNQAKAGRFKDELEKLGALESKLHDYNKHFDSMKNMNRIGDDLNRLARNQALNAIRQGQQRKDNLIKDALMPVLQKPKETKDPWARKMIQAMMANPAMMQNPLAAQMMMQQMAQPSPSKKSKKNRSEDDSEESETSSQKRRKKKKENKKIKELNDELEKNKKAIEDMKNPNKQPQFSKDDIDKLIADAVQKNKDEIEAKAKEVGAGPGDVVTLPNGVSVIKPKDPSKPPLFIMPDLTKQKMLEELKKTKSSLSSTSSISETVSAKPDPMQQMMLGMLMSQNMKMMMGDDSSVSSKSSKARSRSGYSQQPPIIINPPQYYPPQPSLPPIQQPRRQEPSRVQSVKPTQMPPPAQLPSLPPIQPVIAPQVQQPMPPSNPFTNPAPISQPSPIHKSPSIRSVSTLGAPVMAPVKLPHIPDYNPWGLDAPKPAAQLSDSRAPSFRDMEIPSQGKH